MKMELIGSSLSMQDPDSPSYNLHHSSGYKLGPPDPLRGLKHKYSKNSKKNEYFGAELTFDGDRKRRFSAIERHQK